MTYYLRDNSEAIRKKIEDADIHVCICAAFKDACWLDYSTIVGNGVHGVGYYGDEMGTSSQQEQLDLFLSEAQDLVECKDVEEFIAKIKTHADKKEDAKDLLKVMEQFRDNGAFLITESPKKIYCEHDGMGNIALAHNTKWTDRESENIEYIRKDVVEHIIYSSLGPKEILTKLRSL